jgi:hypothetical protein
MFRTCVSQTPRAGFHVAIGSTGQDSSHVLCHHEVGAELVDGLGHDVPQAGAVAGAEPGAAAGGGQVLAGEPACEDVHRFDLGPVDGGDVTEVRDAGVAVGEDFRRGGVDLGVPGDVAADDSLDALLETAVPSEQ